MSITITTSTGKNVEIERANKITTVRIEGSEPQAAALVPLHASQKRNGLVSGLRLAAGRVVGLNQEQQDAFCQYAREIESIEYRQRMTLPEQRQELAIEVGVLIGELYDASAREISNDRQPKTAAIKAKLAAAERALVAFDTAHPEVLAAKVAAELAEVERVRNI